MVRNCLCDRIRLKDDDPARRLSDIRELLRWVGKGTLSTKLNVGVVRVPPVGTLVVYGNDVESGLLECLMIVIEPGKITASAESERSWLPPEPSRSTKRV